MPKALNALIIGAVVGAAVCFSICWLHGDLRHQRELYFSNTSLNDQISYCFTHRLDKKGEVWWARFPCYMVPYYEKV